MKLTELINELKFNTGDAEILLKLDENIEKEYKTLYDSLLGAYLLSIDECVLTVREMSIKGGICEELLGLWFCLRLAALRMYPRYKDHGIGDEYFFSAVANVHRYIAATKAATGKLGIITDRYIRALSHLIELRAFRVGIFNYEFIKIDTSFECGGRIIENGDVCLSMHIPINSDISERSVEYNFALAKEFFKKHFGMENPVCQLYSWLIHPSIAECLPEESKLVKFYKRFSLYEIKNNPASPIEYVFGMDFAEEYRRGCLNFKSYPENTSLQKAFKERLASGLPIGTAKGITLL